MILAGCDIMVPNKFSMVDLDGIDIVESQGIEIPGLYQKLANAIAQCRYQVIYNWKFDGILIPPSNVEMEVDGSEIKINENISVSNADIVYIHSLEPPGPEPVLVSLTATENGTYLPALGQDGFSEVNVNLSIPQPYDSNPVEDGVSNPGLSNKWSRGDHVHPHDTTKLNANGDGSDVTISFTESSSRTNISAGEKLSVIFGKVAKWFTDLGNAAFRGVDATPTENSTNLVESGGIKSAIDNIGAQTAVSPSTYINYVSGITTYRETLIKIAPNIYYYSVTLDGITFGAGETEIGSTTSSFTHENFLPGRVTDYTSAGTKPATVVLIPNGKIRVHCPSAGSAIAFDGLLYI